MKHFAATEAVIELERQDIPRPQDLEPALNIFKCSSCGTQGKKNILVPDPIPHFPVSYGQWAVVMS
jgi:hypothetical protein